MKFRLHIKWRFLSWRDRKKFDEGFRTWLPFPMTSSQIRAAVSRSPSTLVIASAGSGKTTLLLGRAKYLQESGRALKGEVLVLAFNSDAVKEIQARADAANIPLTAKTFHGFGYEVANRNGRRGGVAFSEDQDIENFLKQCIERLMFDEGTTLITFFSEMLVPFRPHQTFRTIEEYAAYSAQMPRSLQNDRIKSHGELVIANFLFTNRISYKYEKRFEPENRNDWSRPDFTVELDDGSEVYIEYFGVDELNQTAPYVDQQRYVANMERQFEKHERNRTRLIALRYSDLRDGLLIEKLSKELRGLNVSLSPRSKEEILVAANSVGYSSRFQRLCKSFLEHSRARGYDGNKLRALRDNDLRKTAFLTLFSQIMDSYLSELKDSGLPDYSAMIHESASAIESRSYDLKYKHILVDEYQDISVDRQALLEAMKVAKPDTEFFFVGDDWQSINRFAGSDINIMRAVQGSTRSVLTQSLGETHRFPQSLADISSHFILKNKAQISKSITSTNLSEVQETLFLHADASLSDVTENVRSVVEHIGDANDGTASLLVLARYRSNLPSLQSVQKIWSGKISIQTIHRSKGTEADFVILTDLIQDFRGFPSTIEDDPLLDLVQPSSEAYEYAEERRLFYVAMTRARIACHLVAPFSKQSLFAAELLSEGMGILVGKPLSEITKCPLCKTGLLSTDAVKRFTSCSNSPVCGFRTPYCPGCNSKLLVLGNEVLEYTCINCVSTSFEICTMCHHGVMTPRDGKGGPFYGCSNYGSTGCRGRSPMASS